MEELRPIMETKPDFYTPIGRPIEDVQRAKAARTQFDSLHHWSTRIESTVLILGLVALFYFTDPDFAHHKGQEGSQRKS
jgi:hypothetical protein